MFAGTEPWAPTTWTPPLAPDAPSDGHRLIRLVERYWRTPDGSRVVLDAWQKALLIAVLETYPEGHPLAGRLRYRQVVISLGRQNGKSLLAAIISAYGLLQHTRGPLVIGVASTREQAQIIYDRTLYVIKHVPTLTKRIKPTGTRGLKFRDGSGGYEMRASKGEALQGLPVTLGLADELHLMRPEVWDSIVNGQRAQPNGTLIGITTAGSDESVLLKRLYKQGQEAVDSPSGRFGFFVWQAPEGATIDSPGALEAANPAIACGRIDADVVRSDVRSLPEVDQKRYALNQWVAAVSGWLPPGAWATAATGGVPADARDITFGVDRSPGWEYATITATTKIDGKIYTEVAASIVKPSLDRLLALCCDLAAKHGGTFALDAFALRPLSQELKNRGIPVFALSQGEVTAACSTAYAKIVQGHLSHADDPLLRVQVPRGRRRSVGEAWRISRADSSVEIDGLLSMVFSVYVAEVAPPRTVQLF